MGDIGIHAHDNMHRALINTLEAHNKGAKWLDSTVNGLRERSWKYKNRRSCI